MAVNTVLAIGVFDGVHRGHQAILRAARQIAGVGGRVVAVTFWPHPATVVRPEAAPDLLCGLEERAVLLRRAGADEVETVAFTAEVAAWEPARFVDQVLCALSPTAVVVGENFRFGARAAADGDRLRELAAGRFGVTVLPMLREDPSTAPVSSSRIRAALAGGDPGAAAAMLGRWFRFSGLVVVGDRRGRTLGFPTANLVVPPGRACPADGVYAGFLTMGEQRFPAAVSVGDNPTFDGHQRRVESHVLDRADLDLYGHRVGVDFVARLRGQQRFASREDLIEQMDQDVAHTRQVLGLGQAGLAVTEPLALDRNPGF